MSFLTAGASQGERQIARSSAWIGWATRSVLATFIWAGCAGAVFAKSEKGAKDATPQANANANASAKGETWRGVVTYVTDGDTLWVRPDAASPPRKLRLDGIDAPEICQAHGVAAREALAQRLLHREVAVKTRRMDDYQRALATVTLQGDDVAAWMVNQGHAWSYRYRKDPGRYAAQEKRARAQGVGLFARSDAVRPRAFRKSHGSCYDTNNPGGPGKSR